MVVATKAKPAAKTKTTTAKSSAKLSWTSGQFMLKANGETIMNETITPKTAAKIWSQIPMAINRGGPGKYTFTVETTNEVGTTTRSTAKAGSATRSNGSR